MKITKKLIERIILCAVAVVTAAVLAIIPISSYVSYLNYVEENSTENSGGGSVAKKPVLQSIDAELKEGVQYYANDIAEARPEHFIVTATYQVEGEEPYTEVLEEDKYDVSTANDFYAKGGDITVSFRGKSDKVSVTLVPVALEKIEIGVTPYTVKYAVGSTFDASGMVVNAVYNDGSVKELEFGEYTVDKTSALTTSDNKVTLKYTEGAVEKTADLEIGVSTTLNNGDVEKIVIVDEAIVNAGDVLTNVAMEVNAVYESGNRKPLTSSEYTVNGSSGAVSFGKEYEIDVVYKADTTKTVTTNVIVRNTIQGENGVIVGGSKNTEAEYEVIDGAFIATGKNVTFAGGFSKSILNGNEGSLAFTFDSETESVGNITMRCSNSYCCFANGTNKNNGYLMQPLQINTILDLTINGREVQVPTNVVLKGCGPYLEDTDEYAPLFGVYYEFTFENVTFDAGVNNVKFNFKPSTVGATNCWGESPSTMNVDYVHFDTIGNEIPQAATITAIEISNSVNLEYGTPCADVTVPVIATLNNGTKVPLSSDKYTVSITGRDAGASYVQFGDNSITVILKEDETITATKTVSVETFEDLIVLNADVVVENNKVMYVFSGYSVGYDAEDLQFFDGNTVYEFSSFNFTPTTFEFKIDVTDLSNRTIYPHLKVDGVNYVNGANDNGDIRGNGLTFTNDKSVTLSGKKYTLKTAYSMPTLVITNA